MSPRQPATRRVLGAIVGAIGLLAVSSALLSTLFFVAVTRHGSALATEHLVSLTLVRAALIGALGLALWRRPTRARAALAAAYLALVEGISVPLLWSDLALPALLTNLAVIGCLGGLRGEDFHLLEPRPSLSEHLTAIRQRIDFERELRALAAAPDDSPRDAIVVEDGDAAGRWRQADRRT